MPNNRRRKLSPRLVDAKGDEQNDGSPQSRQVPYDASMCHGSYSNRDDCNCSASSCDIMADGIENLSLDVKQAKSVRPTAFFIGPELPKVELSYFDGQPRGYWKFLREFETYVESRVKDDGQRLLYLIHYCKGKAKTAIEGCVMLEASFGYKKAKEILKRLFGQAHVIARETLEDLFKTANVDYSDPEQLTNLAIRMENCSMVLKQMKYTADLNSLITLERIVGLLPQVMQAQWADWVDELTEDNREPTFDELTQFIASRARVANSRFGRLANRPRKGHNLKTNCHLQLEQENNSKEKAKCSVCSLDHAIYKCPKFLALTVQERWSQAKVNGICFVCLRQGHKVNECKMTRLCNVDSCKKRHHVLLHTDSTSNVVNDKPSCSEYRKRVVNHISKVQTLENEIRKLYDEFSDAYSSDKSLSVDDKAAIKIGEGSTHFGNGHFVVSIPRKKNPNMKVDNYEVANRRLQSLKGILSKDVSLNIRYIKGIESNFTKTYAERVLEIYLQLNYRPRGYLPHHAALNMKKPEELRVVLDCAAEFAGVSTNDMIYQEPDTTAELRCILISFRKEAVAIPADVEEMFMQLKVSESDRGASRFLWWQEGDMSREPSEFQMTSHPFSAISPPFRANFAFNKMAQIFSDGYDGYGVSAVKNSFYVDDCLISFPRCDQAKSFVKQIGELLRRGGIQKMTDLELWFKCPTLMHGEFCTAITDCPEPTPEDSKFRKTAVVNLSSIKYNMSPILSYYAEWLKLARAVAWLRRFIEFLMVLRSSSCEGSVPLRGLKVKEPDIAKGKNLLMVQKEVCGELFSEFRNRSKVVSHNDLKGLSPILLDGILCVTGRLSYSELLNAFERPVILPSRHLVTQTIIRHCHKEPRHIGRSLEKGYGYVFSCLQTWAVHIEMMCSLITDSFIMALLRCIGRRRKPPEIYSDSASSFVWAVSELRRFVQQSNQQKINSELSARPSSNSMGGVWGRVTKSIPRVLLLNTREQVKQVSLRLRISLCCY
ncbi:unnamed protein product [Schistosoma intercalatum]|nr:unnamed protein product [Schistosoma intercalatum]